MRSVLLIVLALLLVPGVLAIGGFDVYCEFDQTSYVCDEQGFVSCDIIHNIDGSPLYNVSKVLVTVGDSSTSVVRSAYLRSGDRSSGTWEANFTVTEYSPSIIKILSVTVTDNNGNYCTTVGGADCLGSACESNTEFCAMDFGTYVATKNCECTITSDVRSAVCQPDDTKTIIYTPSEGCGDTYETSEIVACDYCTPNWVLDSLTCSDYIENGEGLATAIFTDTKSCYQKTGLTSDKQEPTLSGADIVCYPDAYDAGGASNTKTVFGSTRDWVFSPTTYKLTSGTQISQLANIQPLAIDFDKDGDTDIAVVEGGDINILSYKGLLSTTLSTDFDSIIGNPSIVGYAQGKSVVDEAFADYASTGYGIAVLGYNSSDSFIYFRSYVFNGTWQLKVNIPIDAATRYSDLNCEEDYCYVPTGNSVLRQINPISGAILTYATLSGVSTSKTWSYSQNRPARVTGGVWAFYYITNADTVGVAVCGPTSCDTFDTTVASTEFGNFSQIVSSVGVKVNEATIAYTLLDRGDINDAYLVVNYVNISTPASPSFTDTRYKQYVVDGMNVTCVSNPVRATCDGDLTGFAAASGYVQLEGTDTVVDNTVNDITVYSEMSLEYSALSTSSLLSDDIVACGYNNCVALTNNNGGGGSNIQKFYVLSSGLWEEIPWGTMSFQENILTNGYYSSAQFNVSEAMVSVGLLSADEILFVKGTPIDETGSNTRQAWVYGDLEVWKYTITTSTWELLGTFSYNYANVITSTIPSTADYGSMRPMVCGEFGCRIYGGRSKGYINGLSNYYAERSWVGIIDTDGTVSEFIPSLLTTLAPGGSTYYVANQTIVDYEEISGNVYVLQVVEGNPPEYVLMRFVGGDDSAATLLDYADGFNAISPIFKRSTSGYPTWIKYPLSYASDLCGANGNSTTKIFDSSFQDIYHPTGTSGSEYSCSVRVKYIGPTGVAALRNKTFFATNYLSNRLSSVSVRYPIQYQKGKLSGSMYAVVPIWSSEAVITSEGNVFFPYLADSVSNAICPTAFSNPAGCVPVNTLDYSTDSYVNFFTSPTGSPRYRIQQTASYPYSHSPVVFDSDGSFTKFGMREEVASAVQTVVLEPFTAIECTGTTARSVLGEDLIERPTNILLDESLTTYPGLSCYSYLGGAELTGDVVTEFATPDGIVQTQKSSSYLEDLSLADTAAFGFVDLNSDTYLDLIAVSGTDVYTFITQNNLQFLSSTTLGVAKLACSYDAVNNLLTASASGITARNPSQLITTFELNGERKVSGIGLVETKYRVYSSGNKTVVYTINNGTATDTASCTVNVVYSPPEQPNEFFGSCSYGLDGEFNHLDSPENHGWNLLSSVSSSSYQMTGSALRLIQADVGVGRDLDCPNYKSTLTTRFKTDGGALGFSIAGAAGDTQTAILIDGDQLFVNDWQDTNVVVEGPIYNTFYLPNVFEQDTYYNMTVVLDAYDRAATILIRRSVSDSDRAVVVSTTVAFPNPVMSPGNVYDQLLIRNYVGASYLDYVRFYGEGENAVDPETANSRVYYQYLANCETSGTRDFDSLPPGYLNLASYEAYPNVLSFCSGEGDKTDDDNAKYCDYGDLRSIISYNPDCWREAYAYCVDVTYQFDPDADGEQGISAIGDQEVLSGGLDGAAVCSTYLSTSSGVNSLLVPIWNVIWDSITANALLWIFVGFIVIVSIVVYVKRR